MIPFVCYKIVVLNFEREKHDCMEDLGVDGSVITTDKTMVCPGPFFYLCDDGGFIRILSVLCNIPFAFLWCSFVMQDSPKCQGASMCQVSALQTVGGRLIFM